MAILVNRAKMTTATTGTGMLTLGGAVSGYQSFSDAGVTDAAVVRYVIEDGSNWEIGEGTYTASGTTLSRTVLESSNADAAISLSGDATVFVTAVTEDIQQPPVEGAFVDGDKTKLDGIEELADVTDTTNVTAAGALMDSEVTNLAQVKAFDSADYATAAQGDKADNAMPKAGGTFTGNVTFDETTETVYNLTGTDIDPANGTIQHKTLTANTTFTEALADGQSVLLRLGAGDTYTVTWFTVTWVGGSAPTLTADDVLVFWQEGSTVYGNYLGSVA